MGGLDVDRVLDAIGVESPVALGARTTGRLDLRLEGVEPFGPDWLGHLSGGASAQLLPVGPGLSPTGTIELDLRSSKWSLEHSVRSTAARLSLAGIVSGTLLNGPASGVSTLTGNTSVQVEDLNAVLALVRDAGVALPALLTEGVDGALGGTVTLGGSVARPSIQVTVAAEDIRIRGLPIVQLTSALAVDRQRLRVSSLEARLVSGTLEAAGEYSWSGPFSARFEASTADLSGLVQSLAAAPA